MAGGFNGIWVIVDRFTKTACFIPIKQTFSLEKLVRLYVDKIVCEYETIMSIVLERESCFTSKFLPKLQEGLGTKLCFSTAFHPQTFGQI